jgi:hypothetical protein
VRRTPHRHRDKVVYCEVSATNIHHSGRDLPVPHRCHFEIDQLGRDEPFPAESCPGAIAVRPVIAKGWRKDACIDDDQ